MRLSNLAELARSLDASSFVVRLPDPVLVAGSGFGTLDRGASFDTPDRGFSIGGFRRHDTKIDDGTETALDFPAYESAIAEATPPSGIVSTDPPVIWVAKTERNPFRQMITIGRSPNNDVVLDDKTISKVHAYFAKTDFRWWLHDQTSTNGTFVEESRVSSGGLPLADGAKVSFGPKLAFTFYTPRGLHRLVTGQR